MRGGIVKQVKVWILKLEYVTLNLTPTRCSDLGKGLNLSMLCSASLNKGGWFLTHGDTVHVRAVILWKNIKYEAQNVFLKVVRVCIQGPTGENNFIDDLFLGDCKIYFSL